MFKREKGDDPEGKNGFRVKYKPDGQLFVNPKGMKFAGRRVAKGKPGAQSWRYGASVCDDARLAL